MSFLKDLSVKLGFLESDEDNGRHKDEEVELEDEEYDDEEYEDEDSEKTKKTGHFFSGLAELFFGEKEEEGDSEEETEEEETEPVKAESREKVSKAETKEKEKPRETNRPDNVIHTDRMNRPVQQEQRPNHCERIVNIYRLDDCGNVISHLNDGESILINLENLIEAQECCRVVDILSGAAFAVHAQMKMVAHLSYLLAPVNVNVIDDRENHSGERGHYYR